MSWPRVALDEVATIERSGIDPTLLEEDTLYVGLEHVEAGGKLLDIKPVASGELKSTKFSFSAQHILYGKLRPYLAKIALPDFDGICSTDILPVLPGSLIDRNYLCHYLRHPSMIDYAASRAEGANLPRLSPKALAKFEIPLPPLDEQKRIAAILDKADQLRQKRRQAIALLDSLTQSIFLEMFGDPEETVSLGEVSRRITDGTHQAPNWSDEGIPFLFVSNIRNQSISFETNKFVSQQEYQRLTKNCPIEAGDVLYTAVGSYGNAAVVTLDKAFVFQRHIAQIKPQTDRVSSIFLAFALESAMVRQQADRLARGVAQKTVTLASLRDFEIPLPSIEKQKFFEQKVSKIKELGIDGNVERLNSLFASLQHRAFTGQL